MNKLDYWNRLPDGKEFTTTFQLEAFRRRVPKAARILDVGCGYGRVMAELQTAGYTTVTGTDLAEALLTRGRRLYPDLEFCRQQQPGRLDFPDEKFDAALLCAVLTCIPDDAEQLRLIAEINRVLRPGGILYCNDFLLNDDVRNQERYARFEERFGIHGVFQVEGGGVLRHHSETHIRTLLADFALLEFETLRYRTMNGHTSRGFYCLAQKRQG